MTMNFPMVFTIIVTVVSIFFAGRISVTQNRDYISQQWALQRYRENYLSIAGSTTLIGDGTPLSYNFQSFDGGKSWWTIVEDTEGKITDFIPANPELVQHHFSMIELGEYAKEHGPINTQDSKGINLLESAGFTVKTGE
jgi:hypothetical protein